MTIVLILVVAALGAVGTAYALPVDGPRARLAAVGGVLALVMIALLAVAGAGPATPIAGSDPSVPPGSAWGGALLPGSYLRLVVALAAAMAALLAGMAWLLGGLGELRGLLPSMLAAVAGTTVALSAAQPVVAALGAAGTGLVAVPLILAGRRPGRTFPAVRELRASLLTGAVVAVAAAVGEIVMRIVFADPSANAAQAGSPAVAATGLASLGLGLVVAVRAGAVPFHLRLARLADVTPPIGLPVIAAWIPLPLTVAALVVADNLLAPLALPVDVERGALIALALVGLGGAALAAFIADDLRHAVAYLVAADSALALIAIAALDPSTWGPARAWLVVVLVSKTALGVWSAVVEERFATRAVPDLRGWARRAPVLGAALVIIAFATYGLPGWVSFEVRDFLPRTAVVEPWSTLLMVAGFLTLPTYVRLVMVGLGQPAAHVTRAVPERFGQQIGMRASATGRHVARLGRAVAGRAGRGSASVATLPVEVERVAPSTTRPVHETAAAEATADAQAEVQPPAAESGRIRPASAARNAIARSRAAAAAASRAPTVSAPVPAAVETGAPAGTSATAATANPAGAGTAEDAGAMRPRREASAADQARNAIGPRMGGLRTVAELGRKVVPSADAFRRGRTELLSAAVLLLALLGALVATGGLDVNHAAAEAGTGPGSGVEGN